MRIWIAILLFFTVANVNSAHAVSFLAPFGSHDVHAYVTGYNTLPGQTDDAPCIAASGANICGRTDAVACPRRISLGTYVAIRGEFYVCEDRLAKKYDNRFDISCDKDKICPGLVTGWADIKVLSENLCRLPAAAPVARAIKAATLITSLLRPARVSVGRRRVWGRT